MAGMEQDWTTLEWDSESYTVRRFASPNGRYGVLLRGRSGTDDGIGHIWLREHGEVIAHETGAEPRSAGVSNTGVVAISDWIEYGASTGTELTVGRIDGATILEYETEAAAGLTAVSPDGEYVAFAPYDHTTCIFSTATAELETIHQNEFAERQIPSFEIEDGQLQLEFFGNETDEPLYAISPQGDFLWRSESLEERTYYDTMSLDSSVDWAETVPELVADYAAASDGQVRNQIANVLGDARFVEVDLESEFTTIIEQFERAYAQFEDPDHKRLVAGKLGEANYRLAKARKTNLGTNNAFWTALMDAEAYYRKALPWYDGKDGLAKVRRLQGRIYANRGDTAAAYVCYDEIRKIADWADIQLLSDADERRLSELDPGRDVSDHLPHGTPVTRSEVQGG